jgi:hypothetical protein
MKKLNLILLCFALMGCGVAYIASTYPTRLQKDFSYEDMNFVIIDRIDLKKVFISPSIGSAFSLGSKKSAFGDEGIIELEKQALIEFFDNQKRKCEFKNAKEINNGQYEFDYTCK